MSDTSSYSDSEKLQRAVVSLERSSKRLQWITTANIVLLVLILILFVV